ncbi:hypothetical protein [Clostridium botulinum]|uniref:hypothetical protein n=1 Tax=Clostridium botulinum TaxID=1491 RepID=UPI003DA68304
MKKSELKDTEFILAGYSWIRKKILFWNIYYDKSQEKFIYTTPKNFGEIIFEGNGAKDGQYKLSRLL